MTDKSVMFQVRGKILAVSDSMVNAKFAEPHYATVQPPAWRDVRARVAHVRNHVWDQVREDLGVPGVPGGVNWATFL